MESKEPLKKILLERLAGSIDYSREVSDEEITELIDQVIVQEARHRLIRLEERQKLEKELFYALRKLDVLQELVEDATVTEIMINGPDHIFIEKSGKLFRSEICFEDEQKLQDVIQQIVAKCNRVNKLENITDQEFAALLDYPAEIFEKEDAEYGK